MGGRTAGTPILVAAPCRDEQPASTAAAVAELSAADWHTNGQVRCAHLERWLQMKALSVRVRRAAARRFTYVRHHLLAVSLRWQCLDQLHRLPARRATTDIRFGRRHERFGGCGCTRWR